MLCCGHFRKICGGLCEQTVGFDRKRIRRYAQQSGKSGVHDIARLLRLNLLRSRQRQLCLRAPAERSSLQKRSISNKSELSVLSVRSTGCVPLVAT